ncbi:MAG: alkaline phosphatase [Sphingomonadales bacterium]|nr:alkaline phosphatase [Sphingomonadales bacterium]
MANHSTYILALAASLLTTTALADDAYIKTEDPWYKDGVAALNERLAQQPNTNTAKNIILFVGDGMGISTITAARIYDGQSRGETGEENVLSFEAFPHTALVKTYNTDAQVPDSAGTASALNTGVKTNIGEISTRSNSIGGDCKSFQEGYPETLAEIARRSGKNIGVVSTSLIVDATPAAVYAHSPKRRWYSDKQMSDADRAAGCIDISTQLLNFAPTVALGGGRATFTPNTVNDPEYSDQQGIREDNNNLTEQWLENLNNADYVWNKQGFDNVDVANTDHLLGLFEPSVMQYEADRNDEASGEPSLTEMTKTAIEILSKNDGGYYLMIEGGRIDHAHHMGNAYRALQDTQEFDLAIRQALSMVDLEETLVLVTADHSHVFTIAGYPPRGNPILGLSNTVNYEDPQELALAADDKPYTTLGYWNGPGYVEGERPHLTEEEVQDHEYLQQAAVPKNSESHGGEDVAVFAIGPWAHLVDGTMEQNVIYHIMKHAMGLKE